MKPFEDPEWQGWRFIAASS